MKTIIHAPVPVSPYIPAPGDLFCVNDQSVVWLCLTKDRGVKIYNNSADLPRVYGVSLETGCTDGWHPPCQRFTKLKPKGSDALILEPA